MTFGGLMWHVEPAILFNRAEVNASYLPYVLMTLPFCLASLAITATSPA